MRGHNLFVDTGSQEPLRTNKVKVPRFIILNSFDTHIDGEGKDNFSNKENHFFLIVFMF
jgi:hypothetical protein